MTGTTTYSVKVTDISPSTTEDQLHEYFTFCGKIFSITLDEESNSRSAVIQFEKAQAAKTALMLHGGTLNDAHLSVTSEDLESDEEESQVHTPRTSLDQADKPRAAIAAEYLAKGYALSDQVLQRAIELDSKKGISKRFLSYFHSLDSTLGQKALGPDQTISGKVQSSVSGGISQAKAFDERKGVTKKIGDYYKDALNTSFGQKVHVFYTTTTKHVADIHHEASRLAGWHETSVVKCPEDGEPGHKTA